MSGLPSDEVVDDYKNSLDDLISNDRAAIGNLTVIAKECIDHAQGIARVLENHILRVTPPARKLPAFYVLDSIAKNVGTPYTVYFGMNLYHTYINAFASVDGNVRRKLDEMRKTWSQPVPGSQSTYPVFQKTVTSRIDEAIETFNRKHAQTVAPQMQRMMPQYRNNPTPPQPGYPGYQMAGTGAPGTAPGINGVSNIHGLSQGQAYQNGQSPYPAAPTPPNYQSAANPYSQPSYSTPPPPTIDLNLLKSDIDDLTVDAKIACLSNPMDPVSQTKLTSLQSLKEFVEAGTLSQQELMSVRKSISEQLNVRASSRKPPAPAPQMTHSPQIGQFAQAPQLPLAGQTMPQFPSVAPAATPYQYPPVSQSQTPAIPPFLDSAKLAELIKITTNHPTPPPSHAVSLPQMPPMRSQLPQATMPTAPAENPLIAQLRASGLLPPASAAAISFAPTNVTVSMTVNFSSASFRTPRPEMLRAFLSAKPNRCPTCGRRFTTDDAGREKKARHLDWHFRTKTRTVDAERRGIHRSWYVDEREWIKSREYEDDEIPESDPSNNTANVPEKKKEAIVRVPDDTKLRSEPCPICQEKFESMWSEELQDFIWKNAVQAGKPGATRYYHASCLEEATRDRENQITAAKEKERLEKERLEKLEQARIDKSEGSLTETKPVKVEKGEASTSTPERVLGKRKAESEEGSAKKIKTEA